MWTACRLPKGYGKVGRVPGGESLAHRISWILTNGPIPDGLCVLHRCDNPPCVRTDHLFLGTLADNIHDMDDKGRRVRKGLPGMAHHKAKLTDDTVRAMRMERQRNGTSYPALGRMFGVSTHAAWLATTGRGWSHVPL